MPKSTPVILSVTTLLLVSLACVIPGVAVSVPPTLDQNFWNTAVAQTVAAAVSQSQVAPSSAPVMLVTETPSQTFTPAPPSFTPTQTLTSTPIFSATPLVPLVSVSLATNCRIGPGRIYDRVGALLDGEVAEVYGRNAAGDYWYIRNPDVTNGFCWLWGEYATVSGNTSVLAVFTPPPTPTPLPNFEASYNGKDTCSGWWVDILLKNTGGINFKSVAFTLRDTVTDTLVSVYTDGFVNKDGCLDTITKDNLRPGDTRIISSPAFAYDPAGHLLRATITVCSNPGQSGTCLTKVIEFKP